MAILPNLPWCTQGAIFYADLGSGGLEINEELLPYFWLSIVATVFELRQHAEYLQYRQPTTASHFRQEALRYHEFANQVAEINKLLAYWRVKYS